MNSSKKHLGSSLDDYLRQESLLEEVEEMAAKQAIALKLQTEVNRQGITKSELAARAGTSRSQIARILSTGISSATFGVVERVASALGKRLVFQLVDVARPGSGTVARKRPRRISKSGRAVTPKPGRSTAARSASK